MAVSKHTRNRSNISITETDIEGQFGFGLSLAGQTSYGLREGGKDWTGNSTYLWAIAGAVYMALLGPSGFKELGELIIQQSNYMMVGSTVKFVLQFVEHHHLIWT